MKETINEIVSDVLEIEHFDATQFDRAQNASWDSIKHLEIVMAIEEEFDIRFSAAEVTAIFSIKDLYVLVEQKMA